MGMEKADVTKWTMPRRKVFGVPLQRSFVKNGDGTLLVRGYFTSDRKDEIGDIITREATERALPKYREWGNIRYMHLPKPVAKVVRIGEEDGLEWNEVEILVIDPQAVFEVENGLLQALSVGILVDFDDIEFLEDGGWRINDYQLAEISLVDHPANYDASLRGITTSNQDLRMLAREYGFGLLVKSVDAIQKEATVSEELETKPADFDAIDITPEVQPAENKDISYQGDDETVEENKVSETPEEILCEMCMEPCGDKELEPDLSAAPEPADDVEEPVPADPSAEDDGEQILASLVEEVRVLTMAIDDLRRALETLSEAPEVPVEQETGDEASAGEPEMTGPAANRKGAIPETVLPEEQKQEEVKDLKSALRRYFLCN